MGGELLGLERGDRRRGGSHRNIREDPDGLQGVGTIPRGEAEIRGKINHGSRDIAECQAVRVSQASRVSGGCRDSRRDVLNAQVCDVDVREKRAVVDLAAEQESQRHGPADGVVTQADIGHIAHGCLKGDGAVGIPVDVGIARAENRVLVASDVAVGSESVADLRVPVGDEDGVEPDPRAVDLILDYIVMDKMPLAAKDADSGGAITAFDRVVTEDIVAIHVVGGSRGVVGGPSSQSVVTG